MPLKITFINRAVIGKYRICQPYVYRRLYLCRVTRHGPLYLYMTMLAKYILCPKIWNFVLKNAMKQS